MKTRTSILRETLCLLMIFATGFWQLTAQDPYLQEGTEASEKRARELVNAYQTELGMTVEQAALFKIKAEEFVLRRQKIAERDLSVQEKLKLLRKLSKQETAEMGNILTLPQLRRYRLLKKELQPVRVVVGEIQRS